VLNILVNLANVLMVLTSLFLICLVLIQRGKGGGLAGAFGGMGGSSAFGTKAGDVFTRVTIYTALLWFFLALFLVYTSNSQVSSAFRRGETGSETTAPDDLGLPTDKTSGKSGKGLPEVDKDSSLPPPIGANQTPAVPLNPADAGMKPTTTEPPVKAKTP
jgi:preprotein translocase subunit SecG